MNRSNPPASWTGILAEACRLVHRNRALVWLVMALDALALGAGWTTLGFQGKPGWSIRLVLEMGLPSVGHILNRPLAANMVEFATAAGTPAGSVICAVLLALACFAQGGYLAWLYSAAGNERLTFRQWLRSWGGSMPRFAVLAVTVLLAKAALSLVLAALIGVSGLLLALLVLFVIRVMHLYLEFTMYADKLDFLSAMKPARRVLADTAGRSLAVLTAMYTFTFLISAFTHRFWSPWAVLAAAPVYAYAMTILQAAFMLLFRRARAP